MKRWHTTEGRDDRHSRGGGRRSDQRRCSSKPCDGRSPRAYTPTVREATRALPPKAGTPGGVYTPRGPFGASTSQPERIYRTHPEHGPPIRRGLSGPIRSPGLPSGEVFGVSDAGRSRRRFEGKGTRVPPEKISQTFPRNRSAPVGNRCPPDPTHDTRACMMGLTPPRLQTRWKTRTFDP